MTGYVTDAYIVRSASMSYEVINVSAVLLTTNQNFSDVHISSNDAGHPMHTPALLRGYVVEGFPGHVHTVNVF